MRIGIDLGGTKIEGIVLDRDGKEIIRQRITTPRGDYQPILASIKHFIDTLEELAGGVCSIGIGTPGSLSTKGLLRNSNTTELNGMPLLDDLQKTCDREIRIANDANCFTLSEATDGAGESHNSIFGVIIGTGVGGGLVINGQLVKGKNAIGGEWGHNPLPWQTTQEQTKPKCFCGNRGCIEQFLSGPGLEEDYFQISGERLSAKEITQRANSGEDNANLVFETYEDRLARALAHVMNIVDPDCIVLGGGLSNVSRLYQNVPQRWQNYVFSESIATALASPKHGDSSGVRGAAWLW